jgi:hypothetical protein
MSLPTFAGVPVNIVAEGFQPDPTRPDLVVRGPVVVYGAGQIWATQEGADRLWAAALLANTKGSA